MSASGSRRLAPILASLPVLLTAGLYYPALAGWFANDDFGWLGLIRERAEGASLVRLLFEPMAQGTLRILSERVFFLGLGSLFGLDARSFHVVALLTQLVSVVLLADVARRLTGDARAGVLSALIWAVHPSLASPVAWAAQYNEVLCATCVLGGTREALRLADAEPGARARLWAWFGIGLLTLETAVMLPLFVAALLLDRRPGSARVALPLTAVGLLYVYVHLQVAPLPRSGPYEIDASPAMGLRLFEYARWALSPESQAWPATWAWATALAAFVVARFIDRDRRPLILLLGFAAFIAPVLPLARQRSLSYLVVPALWLAILGGWAAARASRRPAQAVLAAALVASWLWVAGRETRRILSWELEHAEGARRMVVGLQTARRLHTGGLLVLTGLPAEVYQATASLSAPRLFGVEDVVLDERSAASIDAQGADPVAGWQRIGSEELRERVERGEARIYDAATFPLQNVTDLYMDLAHVFDAAPQASAAGCAAEESLAE